MTAAVLGGLTPTEWLILEVLHARCVRMGYSVWPFPTEVRPALRRLEASDLIGFKSGIIYGTCTVWLTANGCRYFTDGTVDVAQSGVDHETVR